MAEDKHDDGTQTGAKPTNGSADDAPQSEDRAGDGERGQQQELAPEMDWLVPYFGAPVVVQTTEALWLVGSASAMPAKNSDGQVGFLGLPELTKDEAGETHASDVFVGVILNPAPCGSRVLMMHQKMSQGKIQGGALYVLRPEQIACVVQAIPSDDQVAEAQARLSGRRIHLPGSPDGHGGKLVT